MRIERSWIMGGAALAALVLLAVPAAAGTVTHGIDVWNTPDDGNTLVDFTSYPIPAGFFCAGSPAFAQQIALKGSPIVTNPANALGKTDTIVERLSDATFTNLTASTTIQVDALSLVQHAPVTISCTGGNKTFNVTVNRDWNPPQGTQTVGPMTINESDSTGAGGTFDATVYVPGLVTFTDTSTGRSLTPLSDVITLQVSGGAWASSPGTGGVVHTSSLQVDSTGGGTANLTVPGTSNLAAGWSRSTSPPSPVPVNHKGPHPTWPLPPPPPCPPPTQQAVLQAIERSVDHRGPIGTSASDGRAEAAGPRVVSVTKYSGGTVVALSHGFEASASANASAIQPIKICYVGTQSGAQANNVIIVGTVDGSPVRAGQ
jgi:hypothetical protein